MCGSFGFQGSEQRIPSFSLLSDVCNGVAQIHEHRSLKSTRCAPHQMCFAWGGPCEVAPKDHDLWYAYVLLGLN